jgi:hypothetical protein
MLFTIFILLLLGAVVFFHYVQGFFSATLSAIFAVIAAVIALSYHEWVIEQFVGDAMGDWGPPLVTLLMFAVTYFVFRVVFDKMIPGQIRLPSTMDKIGGALMGAVAGTFALGTVVIAAQQMPLGPSLAGLVRYETNSTRGVVVPTGGNTRAKDANAYDEVIANTFSPETKKGMIVPIDDVVVGTVAHLSDGGALDTGKPLQSVHPDYLQELFGQRLGVETGSTLTARNLKNKQAVDVLGVYRMPAFTPDRVVDHEFTKMRATPVKLLPLPGDEIRVVLRVSFTPDAADKKDNRIRLAPASVRLVAKRTEAGGEPEFHNYFPIGTIDPSGLLYLNKIDGSPAQPQVDFVFQVQTAGFLLAEEKGKPSPIQPGVFLEVKKFARVALEGDLKGMLRPSMPPPDVIALWRKRLDWEKTADGKWGPAPRNPGGGSGGGGMMGMMSGMPQGGPPGGAPSQGPPPPSATTGALTADQAKARIIGTWESTAAKLTYTFNADGTYSGANTATGKSGKGTWKVKEVVAGGVAVVELVNASGNISEQKWQLGSDTNQMTWQRNTGAPAVFAKKN